MAITLFARLGNISSDGGSAGEAPPDSSPVAVCVVSRRMNRVDLRLQNLRRVIVLRSQTSDANHWRLIKKFRSDVSMQTFHPKS